MPGAACRRALGDAGWRRGVVGVSGRSRDEGWRGRFSPSQYRLSNSPASRRLVSCRRRLIFRVLQHARAPAPARSLLGRGCPSLPRAALPAEGVEASGSRCPADGLPPPAAMPERGQRLCHVQGQGRSVSRLRAVQLRCARSFARLVLGQGTYT